MFAVCLTLITGLIFGVIPALKVSRDFGGLQAGPRVAGGPKERLHSALVIAEVAASVVLLVLSALFIRALWRLQAIDPGFRSSNVLTLRTPLSMPRYRMTQSRVRFYAEVLSGVRSLPGVSDAAYVSFLPMVFDGGVRPITIDGHTNGAEPQLGSLRYVTPGFFATLGIALRAGRDVSESDTIESPFAAVVSESFVRKFWPTDNPIGRPFTFGASRRMVVGVVRDVRFRGLEKWSEPQVYLPYQQVRDASDLFYAPKDLVLRTGGDPLPFVPAIRRIVARADPQQPIANVQLLSDIVDAQTASRALQVRVLSAFAAMAFVLAAVGIHGVLAYTVSQRIREIGVRIALGARSIDILMMILRQGLSMASAGIGLGVVLAYAIGRTVESLLAGIQPSDVSAFGSALGFAIVMTLAGSCWPVLRAVRVDPLVAIRVE